MSNASPTSVVYGTRDAMVAEMSTPEYNEGPFVVQLFGGAGEWDAENFATIEAAKEEAHALGAQFGITVTRIF